MEFYSERAKAARTLAISARKKFRCDGDESRAMLISGKFHTIRTCVNFTLACRRSAAPVIFPITPRAHAHG
jgi:hypothetical protein